MDDIQDVTQSDTDKTVVLTPLAFMDKISGHELDTCKPQQLLCHATLPSDILWDGQIVPILEHFINWFEGHITQQPYMSYIIHPVFICGWFKYGCEHVLVKL